MSLLIGIAGGSGSGKSTTARELIAKIGPENAAYISSDCYYKDQSHLPAEERSKLNFDHPDTIEFELLAEHLKLLKNNEAVDAPEYDFATHTRKPEIQPIDAKSIVVLDGILIFAVKEIRELLDIRIFIDTPADERLARRMMRDVVERGRTYESAMEQWRKTVAPMHERFVEPSKQYAHIIIPNGCNEIAVAMIVALAKDFLR